MHRLLRKMKKRFQIAIVILGVIIMIGLFINFSRRDALVLFDSVNHMMAVELPSANRAPSIKLKSFSPSVVSVNTGLVPGRVIVQEGTVVRFNCTATKENPVYWAVKSHGSTDKKEIHIGERRLVEDFGTSGRFSVEVNKTLRRHDLLIKDVKQSDAGIYICTDDRGSGQRTRAELMVWGSLICQEDQPQKNYMGDNVFGIARDLIKFTCKMNYTGKIFPEIVWFVGDEEKSADMQRKKIGVASSSLTFEATSMRDGSKVTCVVAGGYPPEFVQTGVPWTSDTLQIKYAVLKKEAVEECPGVNNILDCNPPCSYKLETINGVKGCSVRYSTGSDIKLYRAIQSISESGSIVWIAITVLAAATSFTLIALALGYLIKKLRKQ